MAKLLATMPAIRTAMRFESELGVYFSAVMSWHSRNELLSDRAGFRMLEIHEFFFRFELPLFWKKALANAKSCFPKMFASLEEIEDVSVRTRKKQQVEAGVGAAHAELVVKMSKFYFHPENIFLVLLLLGKEGPPFCRALARFLKEKISVDEQDLSFLAADWHLPVVETQLENDFYNLLVIDCDSVLHWLRQHGLAKQAAQAEMRKLALERPSSRGLLAFAKVYPAIFTTLKSVFFSNAMSKPTRRAIARDAPFISYRCEQGAVIS